MDKVHQPLRGDQIGAGKIRFFQRRELGYGRFGLQAPDGRPVIDALFATGLPQIPDRPAVYPINRGV